MLTATTSAPAAALAAVERLRAAGRDSAAAIVLEAGSCRRSRRVSWTPLRIMQTENKLTGRAHSGTSAEAIVELDPEYRAFLKHLTQATCKRELAKTECIAAHLEAQLALALLLAGSGENV